MAVTSTSSAAIARNPAQDTEAAPILLSLLIQQHPAAGAANLTAAAVGGALSSQRGA